MLENLLDQAGEPDGNIRFYADPMSWGYESGLHENDLTLKADRLAMPTKAAIFDLDSWLSADTRRDWNNPERELSAEEENEIPTGYFKVDQREWRAVVRRGIRSELFAAVDRNSSDAKRAAGAFPVVKDANQDRFIGDRRPHNFSIKR